jgi:TonB family protein
MLSGETPLKVVELPPAIHLKYSRMAHLPTLPDPSPRRSPHGQTGSPSSNDSQFSFTELTRLLGQHGAGSSSEDLALDLLLHEVASEACSATNAAGAAIALLRNGEFVCRASAGKHAPDLGSHLSDDSGLSGACIQSREVQRCNDTETDTRVDAAACRRLGVRSVVVVPLLLEREVIGVLEAFSPYANVFTDTDIRTLLTLSQRIMDTMIVPPEKDESDSPITLDVNEVTPLPGRDPWITVLGVLILAVALLLGWVLGHRGLGWTVEGNKAPSTVSAPTKSDVPANETSSAATSTPSTARDATSVTTTTQKAPATTAGGLVVYENGKLVFQVKPTPGDRHPIAVQVPPSAVNSFLIERVEPQYPEPARLAHIQGPVVLQVEVNEKGSVQELRALSGDTQLVMAAAEAVRQWRFKPYAPRGEALDFQTQVTVDFKLP